MSLPPYALCDDLFLPGRPMYSAGVALEARPGSSRGCFTGTVRNPVARVKYEVK
jgi:hypothetical protein